MAHALTDAIVYQPGSKAVLGFPDRYPVFGDPRDTAFHTTGCLPRLFGQPRFAAEPGLLCLRSSLLARFGVMKPMAQFEGTLDFGIGSLTVFTLRDPVVDCESLVDISTTREFHGLQFTVRDEQHGVDFNTFLSAGNEPAFGWHVTVSCIHAEIFTDVPLQDLAIAEFDGFLPTKIGRDVESLICSYLQVPGRAPGVLFLTLEEGSNRLNIFKAVTEIVERERAYAKRRRADIDQAAKEIAEHERKEAPRRAFLEGVRQRLLRLAMLPTGPEPRPEAEAKVECIDLTEDEKEPVIDLTGEETDDDERVKVKQEPDSETETESESDDSKDSDYEQ